MRFLGARLGAGAGCCCATTRPLGQASLPLACEVIIAVVHVDKEFFCVTVMVVTEDRCCLCEWLRSSYLTLGGIVLFDARWDRAVSRDVTVLVQQVCSGGLIMHMQLYQDGNLWPP